jgi:hypothetical protein
MSFDAWLHFIVLAALACGVAYLGFALWTGRLRTHDRILLRGDAPADYWFEFAMMLLILLVISWPAVIRPLLGPEGEFSSFGAAALAALASTGFLQSLRNRRADFFGKPLHRPERPGPYWTLTILLFAMAAAGFAAMFIS